MRLYRRSATVFVLALVTALSTGTSWAGSITIGATSPTITLGETDILVVSIVSTAPLPPPNGFDTLLAVNSHVNSSGAGAVNAGNYRLNPSLPANSSFGFSGTNGTASIAFGSNSLSGLNGSVYAFSFTPSAPGTYTFAFATNVASDVQYSLASGDIFTDTLTPGPAATVFVKPNVIREPGGLTLAAVCLGGLAMRLRWRGVEV
jgi:hypothetical protein